MKLKAIRLTTDKGLSAFPLCQRGVKYKSTASTTAWKPRVLLLLIIFLMSSVCFSAHQAPVKKPDGRKWRIGYLEGGEYFDYQLILKQIIRSLMKDGWIKKTSVPETYYKNHADFWHWAVKNLKSDYLEFVPDGFYSEKFDDEIRKQVKTALKQRINTERDLDLIIAMGTWAGQDMADKQMNTAAVVASTSDPVGSHIVLSEKDSGFDHLHAKIEPDRYRKQVEIFHSLIGFKNLGLIMENSPEGRTYSAYADVISAAKKYRFRVTVCEAPFSGVTQEEAELNAVKCYRELAKKTDAVYVTVHRGITEGNIGTVVDILSSAGIPSFSQRGEGEVASGVLMSISQANFSYAADFHADVISRIFHGEKPRKIPMVWNAPAKITINLVTADRIKWNPPYDILKAADRLYDNIK